MSIGTWTPGARIGLEGISYDSRSGYHKKQYDKTTAKEHQTVV